MTLGSHRPSVHGEALCVKLPGRLNSCGLAWSPRAPKTGTRQRHTAPDRARARNSIAQQPLESGNPHRVWLTGFYSCTRMVSYEAFSTGAVLDADERAELERLRRENAELRLDREFLKEAAVFFVSEHNR